MSAPRLRNSSIIGRSPYHAAIIRPVPIRSAMKSGSTPASSQDLAARMLPASIVTPKRTASGSAPWTVEDATASKTTRAAAVSRTLGTDKVICDRLLLSQKRAHSRQIVSECQSLPGHRPGAMDLTACSRVLFPAALSGSLALHALALLLPSAWLIPSRSLRDESVAVLTARLEPRPATDSAPT